MSGGREGREGGREGRVKKCFLSLRQTALLSAEGKKAVHEQTYNETCSYCSINMVYHRGTFHFTNP
jgi:hypothetical protein